MTSQQQQGEDEDGWLGQRQRRSSASGLTPRMLTVTHDLTKWNDICPQRQMIDHIAVFLETKPDYVSINGMAGTQSVFLASHAITFLCLRPVRVVSQPLASLAGRWRIVGPFPQQCKCKSLSVPEQRHVHMMVACARLVRTDLNLSAPLY